MAIEHKQRGHQVNRRSLATEIRKLPLEMLRVTLVVIVEPVAQAPGIDSDGIELRQPSGQPFVGRLEPGAGIQLGIGQEERGADRLHSIAGVAPGVVCAPERWHQIGWRLRLGGGKLSNSGKQD
ncbi:hypothetical protein [Lysobacter gummosus]|uniref:hypothetical protein n=1 Tax=Lysobacter gummosus TaxID=262324 RepID=UPI00362A69E0